ncbi:DinB family protein [Mitsuaria sp. GD03876]|uniref:DinB family protein n=1 Tax=Mitsuaria sp. GD03876 TaxID=2975399 RepID=UPI00244B1FBD|nr:DinB family protein [Mitsuaria sp. GD03876]MDH0862946.1 DinB family protein [Mitsuaria sp. GD03876]
MSTASMLSTLFRYQAWAHDGFLRAIEALDAGRHPEQRHLALRVLNHVYVVNQIFTGHLTGQPHGYEANNTVDTATPEALRAAHAASDRWFLEYLASITPEQLAERVAFRFTDGDHGAMTREEMLFHVVTHDGYHRGEVGRLLKQIESPLPWDTFAVFLHQDQPERRGQQ